MLQGAGSDTERKLVSILKVLSESSAPLGSITIARELERHGIFLTERAVRYHLRITDERGYTRPLGRAGRMLTQRGLEELKLALAPEQVGFILEKLDLLAFSTTFDPEKRGGLLPINTSFFSRDDFPEAITVMKRAFQAGICVSELVAIASEGEKLGDVTIPAGKVGLATVCSVAINGVLLKNGVPVHARFGGLLEVRDNSPKRFIAVINYAGTSLDPSEQYIRAGMTSVSEAVRGGNGRILANYREIPALARAIVEDVLLKLREAGIGGVYALGNTSEPVCQVAVSLNRVGMVLLGGLNPVAAAVEAGVEVESFAESGMIDYAQLENLSKLMGRGN